MQMIVDERKVKILMVERDINSLSALARKAGISQKGIHNVVGGANWRSDSVTKIATALNCSPLDLITVVDDSDAD